MPGEVVRPVRAARSGWATEPSFRPVFSAMVAHGGLGRLGASRAKRHRISGPSSPSSLRVVRRQQAPRPCRPASADARRKMKPALSTSSTSVLARSFRPGMAARSCARVVSSSLAATAGAVGDVGQDGLELRPPASASSAERR